jgi:hypothetical protein
MKSITILGTIGMIVISGCFSIVLASTYESCTPCHNGRTAPDLRGRFSTTDELISAAKDVKDPLMSLIQVNEPLMRAAAKDLGLK